MKKIKIKWKKNRLGLNDTILGNFLICCQPNSVATENSLMPKILNKQPNQLNQHIILFEVNQNIQQSI